ncbi:MAG: hypothetical protein ACE5J4_01155 [Candidatus Aenigmatarchaeota archaeon]
MAILDIFKKKKKEVPLPEEVISEPLPEDLERFRMRREPEREYPSMVPPPEPLPEYGRPVELPRPEFRAPEPVAPTPAPAADRIEMILQKLETIDTRLKLIEERLSR